MSLIEVAVGIIAVLQPITITLLVRIMQSLARLQAWREEQDRGLTDRRALYSAQQRDSARAVCQGPHECYHRDIQGTNPRLRVYGGAED